MHDICENSLNNSITYFPHESDFYNNKHIYKVFINYKYNLNAPCAPRGSFFVMCSGKEHSF